MLPFKYEEREEIDVNVMKYTNVAFTQDFGNVKSGEEFHCISLDHNEGIMTLCLDIKYGAVCDIYFELRPVSTDIRTMTFDISLIEFFKIRWGNREDISLENFEFSADFDDFLKSGYFARYSKEFEGFSEQMKGKVLKLSVENKNI